jgi:hypothetical protein
LSARRAAQRARRRIKSGGNPRSCSDHRVVRTGSNCLASSFSEHAIKPGGRIGSETPTIGWLNPGSGSRAGIVAKHYLQVTDENFTKATQNNGNGRAKSRTKSEAIPEAKSEAVSAAKPEAAHVGTAEQGVENRPQVLSTKRVTPRLAHSLHSVHLAQVTPTGFEPVLQA